MLPPRVQLPLLRIPTTLPGQSFFVWPPPPIGCKCLYLLTYNMSVCVFVWVRVCVYVRVRACACACVILARAQQFASSAYTCACWPIFFVFFDLIILSSFGCIFLEKKLSVCGRADARGDVRWLWGLRGVPRVTGRDTKLGAALLLRVFVIMTNDDVIFAFYSLFRTHHQNYFSHTLCFYFHLLLAAL